MYTRFVRPAAAGALALTLALAGCHSGRSATAAPASDRPAPDGRSPQAVLLASLPQHTSPAFHFAVSGGDDTFSGVIDGRRTAARFDVVNRYRTVTADLGILVVGRQAWLRVRYREGSGRPVPQAWLTLDHDKAQGRGGPFVFAAENDPGLAGDVFEYGSDIRPTGSGRFTGVTDLSSMYGGRILTPDHLEAITARSAPFTAEVDGQGRLSSLALQLPAGGTYAASTYRVLYDQYGTATTPRPPDAADRTAAPDWIYPMFVNAQFAGPMIR